MRRLGHNGPTEVKSHPWLENFPWNELEKQTLTPPFRPIEQDNFDLANSRSEWKDENPAHLKHSLELLQRKPLTWTVI